MAGIALAVLVKFAIREPERGAMEVDRASSLEKPPFFDSLKVLLKIPTWWYMALGIAFGSFVSYAFSAFQTTYIRLLDPDFNFKTVIIILGIINGTTYAGGTYLGAKLADVWGAKDIRAYGWLPAVAIGISLPVALVLLTVSTVWLHLALTTILLFFLGMYLGPSFAIAQTLAPINMRAMSTALFFFILNMIALGGGPTFAGWMADFFQANHNELVAMRYALYATALMFIPSVLCFLIVARTLPKDWAEAEVRNQ